MTLWCRQTGSLLSISFHLLDQYLLTKYQLNLCSQVIKLWLLAIRL
jgi:hypothetical protein